MIIVMLGPFNIHQEYYLKLINLETLAEVKKKNYLKNV